jgi:hypothetical protein
MAVRLLGGILLTITLGYAFLIVLPAHAQGVYHSSDLGGHGFYGIPPMWRSTDPLTLILCIVPALIPGGPISLIVFLSFGLIFRLILDRSVFSIGEKSFWISVSLGSWIFFYVSSEIIKLFSIWVVD